MLITNIQRFSLHDGPGIRTTVFLKGCSLRCPWCSNPENLNPHLEQYSKDDQLGTYGKEYSIDEVFDEVMKDKVFYDQEGGVTFSGGEALLYARELLPLIKKLKNEGITIAIETSLFAPTANLLMIAELIDFFYVDMKLLEKNKCNDILKGNLDIYKENLDALSRLKKFTVRIPVISNYTDDTENRMLIIATIKKYERSIKKIELIKEHTLGASKYKSLGLVPPESKGIKDEFLLQYKNEIELKINIPIEICKI